MEALTLLFHGFAVLMTWKIMALMLVGLVLGIFVGVLPGLGGPNGVAILLPLTFTMDPTSAIVMLSCIYWGALFGGAITSILFNIPGEAWSVATTFDGYPMAQQGRAAEALTAAFTSSFIGSLVAVMLITFLAPRIASFALQFGPPEFFAVYLLTFCSFVGLGREEKQKTLISMALGLLLAAIGMDTVSGRLRMTFGFDPLMRGVNFLVAVIGLFGISEILLTMEERLALRGHAAKISLRVLWKVWKEMPRYWVTLLRSSAIGCWLGITPGGAIAASFMGYNLAKRFDKDPSSFGKGRIEGVFAPETAAHASGTSALLPMLALGIPGSGTAAILLGGLMVWGLNPGPLLFVEHKDFVWGLIASMYLGNVVGLVIVLTTVPLFAAILRVPFAAVAPMIVVSCAIGAYAIQNAMFDVWLMLGFGVVGYVFKKIGDSAGAVHARAGARQPLRGRVPPVDDRRRRRHARVLVERTRRLDHDARVRPAALAGDRARLRGPWRAAPLGEVMRVRGAAWGAMRVLRTPVRMDRSPQPQHCRLLNGFDSNGDRNSVVAPRASPSAPRVRRDLRPEASRRLAWRLGGHLLHGVLHLGRRRVVDVRRDRPPMPEGILEHAITIAPEHVGHRHDHLGARGHGARRDRVDVLHIQVNGDGGALQCLRPERIPFGHLVDQHHG